MGVNLLKIFYYFKDNAAIFAQPSFLKLFK